MFHWEKLGLLFSPQKIDGRPPWMHEFAQAPSALVFDDYVRIYFATRPQAEKTGNRTSQIGFVDLDRRDLKKIIRVSENPVMPLGGLGTFDEFGTYPISVVRWRDRVLGFYAGWTRTVSVPFDVAIGMAESFDGGNTFVKAGQGPVLGATWDEPFVLSGPKVRVVDDRLWMSYIAGRKWIIADGKPEPVYRIREARSDDGVSWVRTGRDLIPEKIDENEAQASPDVFFWDGRWRMLFCYRKGSGFRSREGGYRVGYAELGKDGQWRRSDEKAGLDVSDTGWDSQMTSYPHVLELDGKLWLFYLGNEVGREGFGWARLKSWEGK